MRVNPRIPPGVVAVVLACAGPSDMAVETPRVSAPVELKGPEPPGPPSNAKGEGSAGDAGAKGGAEEGVKVPGDVTAVPGQGGAEEVMGEAEEAVTASASAPVAGTAAARATRAGASRVRPAQLLGKSRAEVEAALGPATGGAGEWSRHGELELRFRGDRCAGLRGQVPAGMDCEALAAWLGFPAAGFPLRRAESCEWPGISLRHRLAPGVAGSYTPGDGRFVLTHRGG